MRISDSSSSPGKAPTSTRPDSVESRVLEPRVLELWVRDLLSPSRSVAEFLEQPPVLTGLRRLLARGGTARLPGSRGLGELLEGRVAAGALGRYGRDPESGPGFWMRADPVHLQAGQDHALLWDAGMLSLTTAEADQVLADLNEHFAEVGLHLERDGTEQWYARCSEPLNAETRPPESASGRNAYHFHPGGEDGPRLRTWMSEAQMLLHEHPVNRARRAAGAMELTGVWFWGLGVLQSPGELGVDVVWSDDPVLGGAARLEERAWRDGVPEGFAAWSGQAEGGRHGIELRQGAAAARAGDAEAWQAAVETFDRDWLQPALRAVDRGELGELRVLAVPGSVAHGYGRGSRWRFWRRAPDPLAWLMPQAGETP